MNRGTESGNISYEYTVVFDPETSVYTVHFTVSDGKYSIAQKMLHHLEEQLHPPDLKSAIHYGLSKVIEDLLKIHLNDEDKEDER
jgi:hypothetical protein